MKLTKIASLAAVVAALALGAYSAQAAITIVGTTTEYSKVNLSLTIQTNKTPTTSGSTTKYTIGKTKINNKALLSIFAGWTTNNLTEWQDAGAQLVYEWNSSQLCVADKSGTNILFYAGDGINNGTVTANCFLDWSTSGEVYTGTTMNVIPGKLSLTTSGVGEFDLNYEDGDSYDYVHLEANGPNTEKLKASWKSATGTWSGSESFKPYGWGSYFNETAIFSGTITAKGSGPYYLPE
jgi:hypothetical protein